jgi:glutamyl-tRNA reductase
VELLALARGSTSEPEKLLREFLAEFHGVPEAEFAGHLYTWKGADAARHLFEVASSLDSQVLGETEILAQANEFLTQ